MKIDLHVHASERSACSVSGEEDMIRAAASRGLDALVFMDHHCLVPQDHLNELNAKYAPFRVFGGVEITLNEEEDILVLGVREPRLEERNWNVADLHAFVRAHNGWMALAHPFRYKNIVNFDLTKYPPDAIEIRSSNIAAEKHKRIEELIGLSGSRTICTSDAHIANRAGLYYVELNGNPENEIDLVRMLRAGEFRA
ncbi:MAG: PHP domain-containing protein [Kiritimatiellia bacterium]